MLCPISQSQGEETDGSYGQCSIHQQASKVTDKHASKPSHVATVQDAELFLQSFAKSDTNILAMMDNRKKVNIAENRHILKSEAVYRTSGRQ